VIAAVTSTSTCIGANAKELAVCSTNGSIHIPIDYLSIAPVLVLGGGALLLLLVSSVLPKRSRPGLYPFLTLVVGAVGAGVSVWQWIDIDNNGAKTTVGGQVFYDHFAVLFTLLISVATILAALFSDSYLQREGLDGVEAYVLLLMCGSGAMLMAESAGLIMLFLGLEIMSISLYVLSAYHRRREESGEAGIKYFVLGSFSSAIFLYGVALVYGATGSTQFKDMATFLAKNTITEDGVLLAGMALIIVGLGFKVATAAM
jgi:NADH-quinone oxidoreductase subunit N